MLSLSSSPSSQKLPVSRAVLLSIKSAVLTKGYRLSVAAVPPQEIRRLNKVYRKKDSVTDILSFSLEKDCGEIVLCPQEIKRQRLQFGRTYRNFTLFLFIHGLCHLKGYAHGSRMEREEE